MEEPAPHDSSGESTSFTSEDADHLWEDDYVPARKRRYAQVLERQASFAMDEGDYGAAAECYSSILDIIVPYYGELDERCFDTYHNYGFALLRNALVGISPGESTINGDVENDDESSSEDDAAAEDIASGSTDDTKHTPNNDEDKTEYDTKDTPYNGEEESDLDFAWKILDIARAIVERRPTNSMDNVNVLCSLSEANCYRDIDPKICLMDFLLAIHILDYLDDGPDFMERSSLYFRIGSSLEAIGMTTPALMYFEKSLQCCCSRFSVLANVICRSLSESHEKAVRTSTVPFPHPFRTITVTMGIAEQIASVRDYSIMVENKLKEIREVEQSSSNIREAINALSANVRKVPENDVSTSSTTSTDVKVIHLGKVGGSVKKISVDMYSDSIKPSPMKKRKLGESDTGN